MMSMPLEECIGKINAKCPGGLHLWTRDSEIWLLNYSHIRGSVRIEEPSKNISILSSCGIFYRFYAERVVKKLITFKCICFLIKQLQVQLILHLEVDIVFPE